MFCYIEWFFPAYLLNAFVKTQELAMSKGFDDFVAKPFREAVIFEKMALYLSRGVAEEVRTG
ncbi:MAG: hypothetical protein EAZ28_11200 [Oscillatoriales cyanobacterium]|nr:MAG: hypothetical protein EAZ28_11200 [Oscillatoriales cyanobacterium]